MTTRNLIASALLAGTLIAAPTLLLAAGPNGGGGGQAAQRGTTQQTATRTRDRLHAPAAATPASEQQQLRKQIRAQDRAVAAAERHAHRPVTWPMAGEPTRGGPIGPPRHAQGSPTRSTGRHGPEVDQDDPDIGSRSQDRASQPFTGRCSETAWRISSNKGPGRFANISSTSSGTGCPKALR